MEKYFINENLKKEYKRAILNQNIEFYIRMHIESSFSYFPVLESHNI